MDNVINFNSPPKKIDLSREISLLMEDQIEAKQEIKHLIETILATSKPCKNCIIKALAEHIRARESRLEHLMSALQSASSVKGGLA